MTNHAHIQYLVDNFAVVTEEPCRHSPGWFRVSCERCDWYTTGTENYMDECAWDHMRANHVGKILVMRRKGKDLPESVQSRTAYGRHVETWWAITPNGIAHSFGSYFLTYGLALSWIHNFAGDVDFWDPMHEPN